jgi:hypothetical protein
VDLSFPRRATKLLAAVAILWSCFVAFGAGLIIGSMPRSPGLTPLILVAIYLASPIVQLGLFIAGTMREETGAPGAERMYCMSIAALTPALATVAASAWCF